MDGDGTGAVSSLPVGIDCGGSCTAEFAPGTAITLTAQAAPGSTFVRWSGGGCFGSAPCTVMPTTTTAVVATFARLQTVSVVRTGTGDGTVTSTPAGIDCGADCSEAYAPGTSVRLVAVSDATSTFAGWSGGGCSGTGDCVVAADGRDVQATFERGSLTVNVSKIGDGDGLVTSIPPGINCGSDCTEVYPAGTSVTLNASPSVGSELWNWHGLCAGRPCATIGEANIAVEFRLIRSVIAITRAGAGAGTITTVPAGELCSPPGTNYCLAFPRGTTITLTAQADAASRFTGWSEACSGLAPCTITLANPVALTATFEPL